jgi:hypothetical protein
MLVKGENEMIFIPDNHYRNRSNIPATELAKHYGKEVAWSLDGTKIIASGDSPMDVCAAIQKAGLKSDEVVLGYLPFPDEVMLGGAWLDDGETK